MSYASCSCSKAAKEAQKAAKAAKFAAKQAAQAQAAPKHKVPPTRPNEANVSGVLPPFVEDTPAGNKKPLRSFDDVHFKAYTPGAVEAAWYSWWEQSGFFKPQFDQGTGKIYWCDGTECAASRWRDHAGISTQSVVEKMLWKRQQKSRHDLGREAFTKLVWSWKDDYHRSINNAQRRLGGSMDWSREAFTMDENLSRATIEAFSRLHEEGLIYRSERLVNWCTHLNTALSTLEVENKEIPGRTNVSVPGYDKKIEFGVMTYFRYELEGDEKETIEVATTRPETMLGDTGIAVHPQDSRYTHLVGKTARHPFVEGRTLKIVADEYVDQQLGTGAVKLTPAHDANDYKLGQSHGLGFINILNDNGTLNENAGQFQGMKRFDARYAVVDQLKQLGLLVKQESHAMTIPLCEKSKDIIEPVIKPQWWMRMGEMAEAALKAIQDGEITITPESARNFGGVIGSSLRLLHPFLPFIMEELWQRLPRNAQTLNAQSIMIASYPQPDPGLDFATAADEYEIVLMCAKAARSLTVEYGFRESAHIQIQALSPKSHDIVQSQLLSIRSLCGKINPRLEILSLGTEDVSGAKAIYTVSPTINVLLDITEKISDTDAEIEKLQGKLKKRRSLCRSRSRCWIILRSPLELVMRLDAQRKRSWTKPSLP
ncbi:tRNA synthetases class I-domain-containing protein [Massariosphaeria phaeospora]|uniref:valine--tRNA ligase n=1 Tax=Massariosphaeria phaeospora TaxID=100035 RepID=A0A7C8I446_9PLEO|nr:tRNA synthetases class I-domain-containing protein [Massariosphaeria phaeospora]